MRVRTTAYRVNSTRNFGLVFVGVIVPIIKTQQEKKKRKKETKKLISPVTLVVKKEVLKNK